MIEKQYKVIREYNSLEPTTDKNGVIRKVGGTEVKHLDIEATLDVIIAHLNKGEEKNVQIAQLQTVPGGSGEWCLVCGAWKQYGIADTHHCTGYKVIC